MDSETTRSGGQAADLAAQFDAWLAVTGQVPLPAGATVRLPMLTGSMHPALPRGCTLVIEPRPAGDRAIAPGEVAVLSGDGPQAEPGRLVAHRILWRAGDRILEMGDANPRGAWSRATAVVGRVVGAEAPDGTPLAAPASRRQAWRGLLRHWRGVLTGATLPDEK